MKSAMVDIDGVLHSSHGLRFGNVSVSEFLRQTEQLEAIAPGSRDAVVADANALYFASHRFSEAAFLAAYITTASLTMGALSATLVMIAELCRLTLCGPFLVFAPASLSKLLRVVLVPTTVVLAVVFWDSNRVSGPLLMAFAVLQGWFSIGSTVLLTVVRIAIGTLLFALVRRLHGWTLADLRVFCLTCALHWHFGAARDGAS